MTEGRRKMDVGLVFFVFGILALIVAGVLVLKREDTDFKRFIEMSTDIASRVTKIEDSIAKISKDSYEACGSLSADIIALKSQSDRIERVSKEPMPVSVSFPKVVPVSLVYEKREVGSGKESLLERSGVVKKPRPKENN